MGHLDQRTAALTARVSYVFSPELSLDVYAQPFLSAGHYATIREVASPTSKISASDSRPSGQTESNSIPRQTDIR